MEQPAAFAQACIPDLSDTNDCLHSQQQAQACTRPCCLCLNTLGPSQKALVLQAPCVWRPAKRAMHKLALIINIISDTDISMLECHLNGTGSQAHKDMLVQQVKHDPSLQRGIPASRSSSGVNMVVFPSRAVCTAAATSASDFPAALAAATAWLYTCCLTTASKPSASLPGTPYQVLAAPRC